MDFKTKYSVVIVAAVFYALLSSPSKKNTSTVEKFGDKISGKWVYKVNGASATFTLKKQ